MSPRSGASSTSGICFPRLRGDEPWGREKAKAEALFSRLRGDEPEETTSTGQELVFSPPTRG